MCLGKKASKTFPQKALISNTVCLGFALGGSQPLEAACSHLFDLMFKCL